MTGKQIFGPSLPSVETVSYSGQQIETRGLTLDQLIMLLNKHPSVIGLLDTSKEVGAASFADDAATSMVAMATGVYGDEEQESYIANMSAGEKTAFLASIIRQTAPTGIGPFVELLVTLGAGSAEKDSTEDGAIKLRSKKSQEPPTNLQSQDSAAA